MPTTREPHADPTEIFPFEVGKTPADDRMYFEMLSWFVFGSGLNWQVMRAKWPHFLKAFRNFEIAKVARFSEKDVDRLLADAGIIRNGRKITGTIENARTLQAIVREHDSITAWLRSHRGDTDALIRDVKKRLNHMGDTTSRMFLTCVGAIEYQTWEPTSAQRAGKT